MASKENAVDTSTSLPELGSFIKSVQDFQGSNDLPYVKSVQFPNIQLVVINEVTGEKFETSGSSVFYESLSDMRQANINLAITG